MRELLLFKQQLRDTSCDFQSKALEVVMTCIAANVQKVPETCVCETGESYDCCMPAGRCHSAIIIGESTSLGLSLLRDQLKAIKQAVVHAVL